MPKLRAMSEYDKRNWYAQIPLLEIGPGDVEIARADRWLYNILGNCGWEPRPVPIRSSGVKCWLECKRKYMWRERLGVCPSFEYVPALSIGQLFHLIQAELFSGSAPERASEVGSARIEKFKEELFQLADDAGVLPTGRVVTEVISAAESDLQLARAMALSAWALCPWDTERWEVVETEKLYTVRYTGFSPIRGRLDLLVRDRKEGGLYIVDHKTTSKSAKGRAATANFEFQPKLYRLLVQPSYPDEPLKGIIHNIVQKPTIRFCKKDPSFQAYVERVVQWYKDKYEKDPENPPIVRAFTRFGTLPFDEELDILLKEMTRVTRALVKPTNFYKDPTGRACMGVSGSTPCPYFALCNTDPGNWEHVLKTGFIQNYRDDQDEQSETEGAE